MTLPDFTDDATWGDLLEPAIAIARRGDRAEADVYLERYVEYLQRHNPAWTAEYARNIALRNIGYWAGYHGYAAMRQVRDVFGAEHPIFWHPPPDQVALVNVEAGLQTTHIIEIDEDGWGLQHPLSCRPNLLACAFHAAAQHRPAVPPDGPGLYDVDLVDGELVFGQRLQP